MQLVDETKIREIINVAITELVKDEKTIIDFISVLTDNMLYGHLLGVAKCSVQLGMSYGFSERKLVSLAKAGLLHDIGKLFIDRDILYVPRKLTDAERAVVQTHPTLGYEHMKGKTKDKIIMDAIRHHHEKNNGKGYPDGIQKNPFVIEIVVVADIYSALTEPRVYKKAMPLEKVFEILDGDDGLNQSIVQRLKDLTYDDIYSVLRARGFAKMYRRKYHIQQGA